MSQLIGKVIGRWQGADGAIGEVVHDGSGAIGPLRWAAVERLIPPTIHLPTELELMDESRVVLPLAKVARILPDRSGVVVVFSPTVTKPEEGCIEFALPDNAAVFNADGSLRFRLKNPAGPEGEFGAVVSLSSPAGPKLGVRICPKSYPVCESVYVVDGTTDDLGKQLPVWVRD